MSIEAFKGFDEGLKCRGFQYAVGETYEHEGAVVACGSGFHAVEQPLDLFGYYPPASSVYHRVKLDGDLAREDDGDSKVAARKITIGANLSFGDLVKAQIAFVMENVKPSRKKSAVQSEDYSAASNTGDRSAASNTGYYSAASNTGDRSAASNTGDRSAASNTGDRSAASNTGDYSAASNTGYYSAASNTGDYSAASNTGDRSAASNTGNYSAASNTGYQSAASNTGDRSAASNTGYQSAASVSGEHSIAIVTGRDSKARGSRGCWIVLAERDENWHIVKVEAFKVDGKKIKADTYYKLVGGKPVEVADA